MIFARNVTSYVQGYRFSDDPYFYDATRQSFRDMAGYGERAELVINLGSPIFETVDGHRCLKLDNTFHGWGPMPVPWHGSFVAVCKPNYVSGGTVAAYPVLFGDVAAVANGSFRLIHFSGSLRLMLTSGGTGAIEMTDTMPNNNIRVVGYAMDQETRRGYLTRDGVTTTEGPEITADAHSGIRCDFGSAQVGFRFGNLSATPEDTTPSTDMFLYMHEMHFFSENIWTKYPAEAAQMMAGLNAKYGA